MKALILAGGSGTRLWPMSRSEYPKQFLKIGGSQTLLQKTLSRVLGLLPPSDVLIVTNHRYFDAIKAQASEIHRELARRILLEPAAKNTAPAIALALKHLTEIEGCPRDEIILAVPSDHIIDPLEKFCECARQAETLARIGRIVLFGIQPAYPETGYGYIQGGALFQGTARYIDRFIEKPDLQAAKTYIESGTFYWNAGIFAFSSNTMLEELKILHPEIEEPLDRFVQQFPLLPDISIDYAVMEKSQKTIVLPIDFSWSDMGSWDQVYDSFAKDENRNGKMGDVMDIETRDSLILGDKRLIATIGLDSMLIVETPDVILIAKRKESQKVKEMVARLKTLRRKEIQSHVTTNRPWGHFTVLDEGTRYKIKKIVVNPGESLSLQMHYHRSEHWVVVRGTANVKIEERETFVHENESIYVPKGAVHRVGNPGKVALEMIETQVGEYLGEDDIVRFEDVYGRS